MYHEERIIDGKLMFRSSPDGEWYGFTYEALSKRVVAAESRVLPEVRPIDGLLHVARNAENKLRHMGRTFCSTNFTDRYGDGPVMVSIADALQKEIERHSQPQGGE